MSDDPSVPPDDAAGLPDDAADVLDVLEVLEAGLLTTIQDLGRPGHGHLGVSPGGVADPWSAMLANVLVGSRPSDPVLEITLTGPRLRALEPVTMGLAGADLGAVIGSPADIDAGHGRRAAAGRRHRLAAGEELAFDAPREGARAYLAVEGSLSVPTVLGSASTALGAGFGGLEGRALRPGDRLRVGRRSTPRSPGTPIGVDRIPDSLRLPPGTVPGRARVLPGPPMGSGVDDALARLVRTSWLVSPASDRMGLRLEGPQLWTGREDEGWTGGGIPSHGVVRGTVQLPPDGRPIVLLADHQPTGGYPVVAVAIEADASMLAQLAPGDPLRFAEVSLEAALEARRDVREAAALLARLGTAGGESAWDELARWAGA